ncbi:MAG: LytTR family DNA-binding domain-containing protein [Lutimonas sp.]
MTTRTCIIVEDQPPAQRILKTFIEDIKSLELVGIFGEPTAVLDFLKSNQVDLIFLDIHLPKISGLDLLKIIPNSPHVILTTAFSDYALESYELNVVDYLLKPFSFQRFVQAVAKVPFEKNTSGSNAEEAEEGLTNEVFIKTGYDYTKIVISEIEFIKSDADYTEIVIEGKKKISSEPLRHWQELLDQKSFVRIHKSYIVNTSKIQKVSGNRVHLENGEILPIGRAYKDDFSTRFLK